MFYHNCKLCTYVVGQFHTGWEPRNPVYCLVCLPVPGGYLGQRETGNEMSCFIEGEREERRISILILKPREIEKDREREIVLPVRTLYLSCAEKQPFFCENQDKASFLCLRSSICAICFPSSPLNLTSEMKRRAEERGERTVSH